MSLSPSQRHFVKGANKPRSVLAIPPRSILRDELRLARLEQYLEAEFPDLNFVMASENRNVPDAPAAGVLPAKDGSPLFSEEEVDDVLGRVIDAMAFFEGHGERLH